MKRVNAFHGPAIDAYIVPDTDEHQVINYCHSDKGNKLTAVVLYLNENKIRHFAFIGELRGYFFKSAVFIIWYIKYQLLITLKC